MIEFACKTFPIEKVLSCSFGLRKTEMNLLKEGLEKEEFELESMTKSVGRDRTTLQRAAGTLLKKKLLFRRQKNLAKGGYVYIYKTLEKDVLKDMIRKETKKFVKTIENEISKW